MVKRALTWAAVAIEPGEIDDRGLHVCNVAAMRRAFAMLDVRPDYVLTDGFRVDGLGVPSLAVWKGDQVAACVAAASVIAKVTRDRIMCELDRKYPEYGFADHKGYVTPEHQAALVDHGPCPEHRFSYANVAAVAGRPGASGTVGMAPMAVPPPGGALVDLPSVLDDLDPEAVEEAHLGVASGGLGPRPPSMGENEVGMESGAR